MSSDIILVLQCVHRTSYETSDNVCQDLQN